MDFEWSPEEAEFRAAVEDVVTRHLDPNWNRSPASLGSSQWTPMTAAFCRHLADHHLLVPSWPTEYGGNDAPVWQQQILAEVMWEHGEPRGPQYMNVNWIGPAIIAFGSDEQKASFLPAMARGEIVWCQGFSEPDAGSDLASLRTAARRDGDCYVVNGQKIWTSYADTAQHCFLLVRTGTVESRHRGLTVLLVPTTTPGLEVRKIDSIAGEHAFHEVFLNDVMVPASLRLGEENKGWAVVRHALAYERIGLPRYVRASQVLNLVAERARAAGRLGDSGVQSRMAEARACCEAARLLVYRAVDERARGEGPSASAYLARAAVVDAERAVAAAANDALGTGAGAPGDLADVQLRNALAVGLAGGAYEIQLGLVAEQLLGLPPELTMDLQLSEEQELIRQGATALLRRHGGVERARALEGGYDADLEAALAESGYLSTVAGPGGSGLEAAIVLEAVAMGLGSAAVGALGLVAPMLGLEAPRGPLAITSAHTLEADVPLRYGATGGHVLVVGRGEAQICPVTKAAPAPQPWGYPAARVELAPGTGLGPDSAETLRTWWWLSVAVEVAANAAMALDQALCHVKERHQFGRPLGQFQSTQHRLAQVSVKVEGARWLAWRAAWSGNVEQAALAAAHALSAGTRAVAECHQVCGAIGLTTEFDLHLWTMRISTLCAELGGVTAMQAEAARRCWPSSGSGV